MSHKYSALAVLMMIFFLAACSSGGGNQSPGTARVGLTIRVPAAAEKASITNREKSFAPAPAPIATIGVSVVDAEGRLLTSTRVSVSPGQEVTVTLEVPAGRARTFTVQAIDESGTVLFQGQGSADLTAGTPTALAIRMEPINLIPTLSISPTTLSILIGKTQLFTATLTGPADPALIWSVNDITDGNSAFGTITPSSATTATYTAPTILPDSNPVIIKVSSASNPELAATAVVTLLTAPSTVFIDNEIGIDSPECGTESVPCKTITQGLALAQAGQTLLVASGTYNFGTGIGKEPAPLTMKAGVDIQGTGAETTILNMDSTNDPDGAGILGADNTTLSGFTIQDEDSVQFHISLTGTTTISDNRFIDLCPHCNTAVRARGNGAPTIIGNTFGQAGFGLTTAVLVEDTASPTVARNTFSGNRTAIETRLSATPKIEANTITGNEVGISVRNNSNPDLGGGNQGSTGGNILSCNTDTDLNIITPQEIAGRNNFWDHVPPRRSEKQYTDHCHSGRPRWGRTDRLRYQWNIYRERGADHLRLAVQYGFFSVPTGGPTYPYSHDGEQCECPKRRRFNPDYNRQHPSVRLYHCPATRPDSRLRTGFDHGNRFRHNLRDSARRVFPGQRQPGE